MLLSSVSFVNKARSEKHFRREKDRAIVKEKSEDLTYCKKHAEKVSKSKKFVKTNEKSEEVSESTTGTDVSSPRTSGYGSCTSVTSSDISLNSPPPSTDRVSITTLDEYNLYIDPTFYFVTLCKQKQITNCSSFTRHVIQTKTHENGRREHTVQFCLTCDPDYFLTTNVHRQLELKLFGVDTSASDDDERLFMIHESTTGQSFIQPANHKGYYLHHLSDKLSVRKLEFNLRPPEEYVFHVHSHGNTNLQTSRNDNDVSSRYDAEKQKQFTSKQSSVQYSQHNSCMYQNFSVCTCINKCDAHDKLRTDKRQNEEHTNTIYKEVRTDKLSSLNSDVIKLSGPLRTRVENGTPSKEASDKKAAQAKRNSSFYNVVSMTGGCFGFGKKTED